MPRLIIASKNLPDNFFKDILSDFKKAGVKVDKLNYIDKILFFKSADEQNVLQVIFLAA